LRITAQEPKTAARRFQQVVRVAFHLLPILVISALWLSVIRAYQISEVKITDEMVQQARESPPDSVLEELKDFDFMQDRWERTELVDSASQLQGGNLRFQDCSAHIVITFSARDLDHIPPACELPLAGFYVPDVLLRA
jgi:hypothetical protein